MYISILYIDIHTCASNEYLFMFSHCSDFIYNAWNCARIERERGKRGRKKRKKRSSVKKRLLFARRISDSSVSRYPVACIAGDRSENRVEKMKRKKNMEKWMLAVRLECGSLFLFVSHEEASRESRFLEERND